MMVDGLWWKMLSQERSKYNIHQPSLYSYFSLWLILPQIAYFYYNFHQLCTYFRFKIYIYMRVKAMTTHASEVLGKIRLCYQTNKTNPSGISVIVGACWLAGSFLHISYNFRWRGRAEWNGSYNNTFCRSSA